MVQNPYESPAPSAKPPVRPSRLLFRILAIFFWLLSLLTVWAFLSVVSLPQNLERRTSDPALFWGLCAIMFALPAIGLVLLGIASWWRVRWLAYVGIAAFGPIILATIYGLIRSR
jgi:hypothetical protein